MFELGKGDLLKAEVEALVNTVNLQGVMGKGIALQFKKAFPENYKVYRKACKDGELQLGRMFIHQLGMLSPKFIINFPTKDHWKSKSRLSDIDAGLQDLALQVKRFKIRSVAVPPLGCGLGGLDWAEVKPLIEQHLDSLDDVRVVLFEPKGAPPAKSMVNRTRRPKMTAGRAALLAAMNRYDAPGYEYPLSLLEIQKLAYFLQTAGEPLKLEYKAHIYGPYADALRHVLNHIEGHFTIGYGAGNAAPETPIKLLPGAAEAAEGFLQKKPDTHKRLSAVARLIEGFETPLGMELLATVHWVASHDSDVNDPVNAIAAVQQWSSRKAESMRPVQIRAAWQRLSEQGWLSSSPAIEA